MRIFLCFLAPFLSLVNTCCSAQEIFQDTNEIRISAYTDVYFSSYSNDLSQQIFQPYSSSGARDNTFGVNIAQVGIHYKNNSFRGNFIYHDGDIPQATWSNDFNNLQEGNVGLKLLKDLWLDIGFFATHVGTESFLPKNNLLGHASFITYNEPFYQAGAKLSYELLDSWSIELWIANGYNRHVDNNDAKSLGMLISREFTRNLSLTYTNLYGRESDDSLSDSQIRFYNNLYLNYNWNKKVFIIAGIDMGMQTNTDIKDPEKMAYMHTALFILRYQLTEKYSLTCRGELSNDDSGFINGVYQPDLNSVEGINLRGISLGGEYKPNRNGYVRLEGRYTQTGKNQNIFSENGNVTNQRYDVLFTMGFFLDKVFQF